MSKKSRQLAPSGSISVGPTFSSNEAMSISSRSRVQILSSSTSSSSESAYKGLGIEGIIQRHRQQPLLGAMIFKLIKLGLQILIGFAKLLIFLLQLLTN